MCDFSLPDFSGLEALAIFKKVESDVPFIIVSGTIGEAHVVEMMKAGASDYILKSDLSRLVPAVRRELATARLRVQNRAVEKTLQETEAQLRHAQKMEAIGQLAGGVAHDFNNMLATIGIYCERLLEVEHERAASYAEKILKVQQKAAALTNQLLIVSRRQLIQVAPLNLNHVITETQSVLARLLGESVSLSTNLEEELHPTWADKNLIEQLLMNLTVNARDAMPKGGELQIRTKNASFTEPYQLVTATLAPGQYVVLELSDSGIGMSEEIKARIFEPFFTTKALGKGVGLGLSIVYGIVHQSQGGIKVSSRVGSGTTLSIYLPAHNEIPEGSIAEQRFAVSTPEDRNGTILVVEDETELRDLLSDSLVDGGYKVLTASDGAEALNMVLRENGQIDLILTDLVMSNLGGEALYERVSEKWNHVKFIFMSGYASNALKTFRMSTNEIHILNKPFSVSRLLSTVNAVIEGA